jgi:hypothetical protein
LAATNTGALQFLLSSDGTANTVNQTSSAHSLVSGTTYWVGADYNTATGTLNFYKANDASEPPAFWGGWTLVSTHAVTAAVPFNSDQAITIGARGDGITNVAAGKFYRAQFYTNATALQFDANFATKTTIANFTESSSNAATVTMNGAQAQAGDGSLVINSSTPGTAATISQPNGQVAGDYLVIKDSSAVGGAFFYAGAHSVDAGNNTGWIFGAIPIRPVFTLGGTAIRSPNSMRETTQKQYAQQRPLSGSVNRKYYGSTKRVWELQYNNLNKTDYNTIRALYNSYLSTGTPQAFLLTSSGFTDFLSTNVHLSMPDTGFPKTATYYLTNFTLTLKED